jgi:type II secretory pathway pseudopilin PulG
MKQSKKVKLRFPPGQWGISLLETVLALGLIGLIGVAFIDGLTTSSKTVILSQGNVAAESLAKSQVEYIKAQDYIWVDEYNPQNCYDEIDIPADLAGSGFDIEISTPVSIIAPDLGPFELQSITIIIKHNDSVVLTISLYRHGSTAL